MFFSLHELLLQPISRVTAYVRLLSWLKANTPLDHPDRDDVSTALQQFKEAERIIRQVQDVVYFQFHLVAIVTALLTKSQEKCVSQTRI